ncbi:heme biosynthesis protein HemY [Gemmobacter aquaticus]|uniref:Heme biosynthesis protein HemY n=1 Tax=Gemmobacter aquaticus TaxID=490185 RepID=A0A917YK37_9RHOB|nr:heme biosynthesis HemY N-terminal domain-containing protein [Gemmobacter aquaticus]GGO33289.1 heme biosynthesis protein HemY [Gemmobacter aquaticus]
MIWALIKVLLFFAAVAGITWGATFLINSGDGIRITAAGYEFTLGALQAVILVLVTMAGLWLLTKLIGLIVAVLRFVNGDETALTRYFDRNRERKGYAALSEGMVALAAGENRVALSRAIKAERLLGNPEITNIMVAQAAEAAGDTQRAEQAYKALLGHQDTRFVGIRGLLGQRLAAGDTETALRLAQKAFELKPKQADIQDVLLKLQAGSQDWKGARATLEAKRRSGTLAKDIYRRRDAVLALQEARKVMEEGTTIEAREAAIAANKASPDLVPAAAMAARGLALSGDAKGATRIIRKAWEAQPHPDLAAAFADIAPDETPSERLKRFRTLTEIHPDDPETRMLRAELLIAAEDFPGARRVLGDLPETAPTGRMLALRAAIARGEGADDAEVRAWLAKAVTAPRGPQWCCDKCHAIHAEWVPICENCGGFDTLSWREPPQTATPSPTGTEMLPLLVNPPAPRHAPTVETTHVDDAEDEPVDLAAIARSAN